MTSESRVQPKIRDNIKNMLILWRRECRGTDLGIDNTAKNAISLFPEIISLFKKQPQVPTGKESWGKHSQEDASERTAHCWTSRNVTLLGVNRHRLIFFEFYSKVLTGEQVGEPDYSSKSECRNCEGQRVAWRPAWRGPKPIWFNGRDLRAWFKEEEAKCKGQPKPVYSCWGRENLMGRKHQHFPSNLKSSQCLENLL